MGFEVDTKYTIEEYKRFNKTIVNVLHNSRKKAVIAIAIIVLLTIFLIMDKMYKQAAFMVLFWIFFIIILNIKARRNIVKTWNTNKLMKDSINHYRFMENELQIDSAMGNETVSYSNLYRIIETKTNFYLMIADNMGYIISKDNCTEEQQSNIRSLQKYCSS